MISVVSEKPEPTCCPGKEGSRKWGGGLERSHRKNY